MCNQIRSPFAILDDIRPGEWNQARPVAPPEFDMGDYLAKSGLRVVHIHPSAPTGIPDLDELAPTHETTVVYEPRKDRNHTIEISTALCSPNDSFSRKQGVAIALARWEEGKRVKLPARTGRLSDVELLKTYFE